MMLSKKITDVQSGEFLVDKGLLPEDEAAICEDLVNMVEKSVAKLGDIFMVTVRLDVHVQVRQKTVIAKVETPLEIAG